MAFLKSAVRLLCSFLTLVFILSCDDNSESTTELILISQDNYLSTEQSTQYQLLAMDSKRNLKDVTSEATWSSTQTLNMD